MRRKGLRFNRTRRRMFASPYPSNSDDETEQNSAKPNGKPTLLLFALLWTAFRIHLILMSGARLFFNTDTTPVGKRKMKKDSIATLDGFLKHTFPGNVTSNTGEDGYYSRFYKFFGQTIQGRSTPTTIKTTVQRSFWKRMIAIDLHFILKLTHE